MDDNRQRILIYGGTFDPPHAAHVHLPPLVADRLNCTRLLYVPAAVNPLKADDPPTSDAHRLAMLALALNETPDAEICTVELDRQGPSYTVDTLRELHARFGPGIDIVLLIGADQALEFHRWKDWPSILELSQPAVMLRPPWNRAQLAAALRERYSADEADWWLERVVDVPILDVSATEIRRRLADGRSLDGLIDPAVQQYIREHRLYQPRESVQA